MLAPPVICKDKATAHGRVRAAELEFYRSYEWCLNLYPTVQEAAHQLRNELDKLASASNGWQIEEIKTNIFLLSCGLLNCVDEYLRGPAVALPKRLMRTVAGRGINRFTEIISNKPLQRRRIACWRGRWLTSLNNFLVLLVSPQPIDREHLQKASRALMILLDLPFPSRLQSQRISVANAFSRLDLTQKDILALGETFIRRFPNRRQPILLLGLRTSGSYFVPLLKALFELEGYQEVALLTIEPNKGVGQSEKNELKWFAARGYWALIVDDPPHTSRTMLAALDIARQAGFTFERVKFMAPAHPAKPNWFATFPEDSIVTLLPEQWHKNKLLNSRSASLRIIEYFRDQNFAHVAVSTDEYSSCSQHVASDERGVRLKHVFKVDLASADGTRHTKYILAKSVGWGWLSYHAFLIGQKLANHVPPMLGLRDGILYMEWLPQRAIATDGQGALLLDACASYVAARARHLGLDQSVVGMNLKRHSFGSQILGTVISRAYGWSVPEWLMRSRVDERIRHRECPCPTHIDGNMHRREWIWGPKGPLKTDYEHHGMGKTALNITDPAYDLADVILNFELSTAEEQKLIRKYIAETGDSAVEQRLHLHKLLAGLWAMSRAQSRLFDSIGGTEVQQNCHRDFMNAWNFLTVQTARRCGSFCHPRANLSWRSPLVALDIDGVVDRRLFGFPCTTAAGIEAISLLNVHNICAVFNTARSAAEVKDYCQAYSLAGGVAEHGSYLWDAIHQRERVLISAEAERQLAELRRSLQAIPGVFLDSRHQYSIRAFTYRDKQSGLIQSLIGSARASSIGDGALAPISTHIVQRLFADMHLDRLAFHHTTIDTTITASEVNKGTGLNALRDWVLSKEAETIAVGDSDHDLSMFRVATRSFAPANINCKGPAKLNGCRIASQSNQRGLVEIVRQIIHADGKPCVQCDYSDSLTPRSNEDPFLSALHVADQSWMFNLFKSILSPAVFAGFLR